MNPFNLATFPLTGISLIEASAGTGKTYSIVRIYLRQVIEAGIPVGSIVVATFTNAATDELRLRIREVLSMTWQLASGRRQPESFSPEIQGTVKELDSLIRDTSAVLCSDNHQSGRNLIATRVRLALLGLDAAPIRTIDAMCLQWAREFALETGADLNTFEATDGSSILATAVQRELVHLSCSADPRDSQLVARLGLAGRDGRIELAEWIKRVTEFGTANLKELPDADYRQDLIDRLKLWPEERRRRTAQLIVENTGKWFNQARDKIPALYFSDADKAAETFSIMDAVASGPAFVPLDALDSLSGKKLGDWFTRSGQAKTDAPILEVRELQKIFRLARLAVWADVHSRVLLSAGRVERWLQRLKYDQGLLTYDDITSLIVTAIRNQQRIRTSIATRYPVALIDEFQDSSPDQVTVFVETYRDNGCLVMIGDPKQAIYGFRGGDIFAYLSAKRIVDPGQRFYLENNFRSTQPYLDAVNLLFDNAHNPFLGTDQDSGRADDATAIEYLDVIAGKDWQQRLEWGELVTDDQPDFRPPPPIEVVLQSKAGTAVGPPGQEHMPGPVTAVLQRLLHGNVHFERKRDDGSRLERRILPSDIAILVRTNLVAQRIYHTLSTLGYPVTCQSQQGIFASVEAMELLTLLEACARPSNEMRVRAALTTRLMGLGLVELEKEINDEVCWEKRLVEFSRYRDQWKSIGVLSLLYGRIAHRAARFLDQPGGPRVLTNWLQLAELCQEAQDGHPTPSRLLQWLRQSIQNSQKPEGNFDDRQLLRLETDENAVRVVTLHSSKGLEYPVVILVDPWRPINRQLPESMADPKYGPFTYHDVEGRLRLEFDVCGRDEAASRKFQEELQEDLRLTYVGLTRARYRCSFLWGEKFHKGMWKSGFQWLVCDRDSRSMDGTMPTGASTMKRLSELENKHPRLFEVSKSVPPFEPTSWLPPEGSATDEGLEARTLGHIEPDHWSVTSFSAIKRGAATDSNAVEYLDADESGPEGSLVDSQNERPAFQGPTGTSFGNAFHMVMERALTDRITDGNEGQRLAARHLARYGVPVGDDTASQTWALARRVMHLPLLSGGNPRLADLGPDALVAELEFHMTMAQCGTSDLAAILRDERWTDSHRFTANLLEQQQFPLEGLLHGFIDLTFEWQNKFYILDYKTNWLGHTMGHYGRSSLDLAMQRSNYDLQCLIYTVAVHRWLRGMQAADYSYKKRFGGVFYLFVRGMNPDGREGIWFQRPHDDLILGIEQIFQEPEQGVA